MAIESRSGSGVARAAIQTLSNVSELSNFLLANEHHFSHLPLVGRYGQMLQLMLKNKITATPKALKEAISEKTSQFPDFVQHDSQEFLQFFLDALAAELKNTTGKGEEGRADDGNFHENGMWQNANNHWKKEALTLKERSIDFGFVCWTVPLQIALPKLCALVQHLRVVHNYGCSVRHAMQIPMPTELVSLKQHICERIGIATGEGHIITQNKSDQKYNCG
ncbi:hypothetical protein GPALN_004435 [Globodera pallida]|nr:hypothetical protein GPALN_004435 [Globodera pallida]